MVLKIIKTVMVMVMMMTMKKGRTVMKRVLLHESQDSPKPCGCRRFYSTALCSPIFSAMYALLHSAFLHCAAAHA